MPTYTIGQLAKRFALSRSTLLYYDNIGLLSPSARSAANYRLYTEQDLQRMEKIALYREAGVPLEGIARILGHEGDQLRAVLERRLTEIGREIAGLRNQQRVIVGLLGLETETGLPRVITKASWVSLLRATGLDDEGLRRWHREFERMSPHAHRDFLQALGIEDEEIEQIRRSAVE